MSTPASELPLDHASVQSDERIWPALTVAPLLAWLADYLFWRHEIGVSFGLYLCAAASCVMALHWRRDRRVPAGIACGLMLLAASATALETSFTNTMVLVALLTVIAGESFYGDVVGGAWARWSQMWVGWVCVVGRWQWFFRRLATSALVRLGLSRAAGDNFARSLQAIGPAACLGVVFLAVFEAGNAVFRQLCEQMFKEVTDWIAALDFSIGHLVFWLVMSTLALSLVQPRPATPGPRFWMHQWSRVGRKDRSVAVWQSRSILVVLNALFFAVNTIDVSYLWQHAKLPEGVTFSEFVHTGVYSLIFATLLSAAVLASIFQQAVEIVQARGIKALAFLWIGQNLMLIAGVFLRLKLYVVAYQLTELRIYVGCFLLLVTAGFGLLAWHVARDGSLNSLIFRNVLATFALFFVVQFADVAGVVARFNVAQWRQDRLRTLDTEYLERLGPSGWRALCSVATEQTSFDVVNARERVRRLYAVEEERRSQLDWRSFQWRRERAARQLAETVKVIGKP